MANRCQFYYRMQIVDLYLNYGGLFLDNRGQKLPRTSTEIGHISWYEMTNVIHARFIQWWQYTCKAKRGILMALRCSGYLVNLFALISFRSNLEPKRVRPILLCMEVFWLIRLEISRKVSILLRRKRTNLNISPWVLEFYISPVLCL